LNGAAYVEPAAFDPNDHAHHGSVPFARDRFQRVRFVNASYRLHPMHVHGMFFKVLARNGTPVDEPYWRDTTLVHAQETVDVGLVPLDPGRWMLHCHILEHADSGMMTTVVVEP
jgi:FtsP/CotA-like multicopper oxidase with cupredoxin domain